MVEVEELGFQASASRRAQASWLASVFFRPVRTMRAVAAEERPVWVLPLLLLTILTLASVLVAGPLRQEAARTASVELPPSFEYMSPDQQQQYMQAQQNSASTTMTIVFPGTGALIGLWLSWFLLGGILHLGLTMLGSRSTSTAAFNLAAWASLTFAVRLIVQIIAMLTTHQLIHSPGVSGFLPADATGLLLFLKIILSMVDLYLIFQLVLLTIGAASTPGLARARAFGGVLASLILLLVLSALPGFLAAQLSGLSVDRPFFFF